MPREHDLRVMAAMLRLDAHVRLGDGDALGVETPLQRAMQCPAEHRQFGAGKGQHRPEAVPGQIERVGFADEPEATPTKEQLIADWAPTAAGSCSAICSMCAGSIVSYLAPITRVGGTFLCDFAQTWRSLCESQSFTQARKDKQSRRKTIFRLRH